ncbi:hypothetical protein Ancab_024208 [Ancistrocladus abbreviatus]
MANTTSLLLISAIYVIAIRTLVTVNASPESRILIDWAGSTPPSNGSMIAGSLNNDDEFELDSEANRRFLATSKYISYAALNKNSVPCSQRGASYYNCKPGAQANPYSRGCSKISRCRQ